MRNARRQRDLLTSFIACDRRAGTPRRSVANRADLFDHEGCPAARKRNVVVDLYPISAELELVRRFALRLRNESAGND